MPGLKNGVRGVVESPILMEQPFVGFHLPEERRRRVRCEDVKGGTLQSIFFYPLRRARKNIFAVMIETEHEGAVDLNAEFVKHVHPARVV